MLDENVVISVKINTNLILSWKSDQSCKQSSNHYGMFEIGKICI